MYNELIDALRNCGNYNGVLGTCHKCDYIMIPDCRMELMRRASDAIEQIAEKLTKQSGKWMPAYFDNKPLFYFCSKCELRVMKPDGINYCPNCGAKMDGGKGDDAQS